MAADHDMDNTSKSGITDPDTSVSPSVTDQVHLSLLVDDSEADDILFPERRITLDRKNNSVAIGRASKVQSKGFVEAAGNAWFPSPVMSRQHAEIIANLDEKRVQVRDLGSLHGTYINDELSRVNRDELRDIKDGDLLRFGVGIWRGSDSFAPTTVKVGIVHTDRDSSSKDDHATTTFQVPDGSEDGSDMEDYSSDDSHSVKESSLPATPPAKKAGETPSSDIIDLTEQPYHPPHNGSGRRTAGLGGARSCEVIDLSMDEDDLESLNNSAVIEIEDDDSEHLDHSSPPPRAPSPDYDIPAYFNPLYELPTIVQMHAKLDELSDQERSSIHRMTDNEDESMSEDGMLSTDSQVGSESASGSDDSEDDSEGESMDDELDDIPDDPQEYMSWDAEYSEEEEEDEEEESSEEQDGKSIYSDTSCRARPLIISEIDRWDDVPLAADTKSGPEMALPAPRLPLPAEVVSTVAKGITPVRIEGLLNNYPDCTAPIAHSIAIPMYPSRSARQASPSDAAMPKSIMRSPSDPNAKTTAELLSLKHGKFDFFVAREDNRNATRNGERLVPLDEKVMNPIPSTGNFGDAPRVPSSVHNLCHKEGPFGQQAGTAGEGPESHGPTLPEQMADAMLGLPSTAGVSAPSAPEKDLAASIVDSFVVGPAPIQALATPATSPQVSDPAAPGLQLDRAGQAVDGEAPTGIALDQSSRRTQLNISDIVDACQPVANDNKGKRKAQEISELNPDEETWVAREKDREKPLSPQPLPSPPADTMADAVVAAFDGMEKESLPLSPAESIQESIRTDVHGQRITASVATSHGRPIKKLRGGIREFGYLALGGVTASALLLSGMIYTAPTF
ncbi:hypothetical protein B0T19DRAFT_441412 [Cercophora scortea]|uniref:FHA domain-containing protein n=1 Tax=Cercophora scortea TaxID=314031 RepID=A0AAE0MD70_9PEZI|nr:hypothetical protein B0T19DRAFT_441412 [Cercophora scortea]